MKYIKNGKFILPDGILENVVLAYDNKICGFTTEEEIPSDAKVIYANGGYVVPGLVDIHIHGYLGEDTSDGNAEGIFKMANGIMKNGVTSWCPTTMTVSTEEINTALEVVRSLKEKSKSWQGAEIILERANQVINQEFPDLAKKCQLHIPDEKARCVGQSVAAASLPKIK